MNAELIDGRPVAADIRAQAAQRAAAFAARAGRAPALAAVVVGDDPATTSYVGMQAKAADKVGVTLSPIALPADAGPGRVAEVLTRLNADATVDGVLLAAPLPAGYDAFALRETILPRKDAEGLTTASLGLLFADAPGPRPATAVAILALLDSAGVALEGRAVAVIGRSLVVGKPAAVLLLARHATVTLCHSRTVDLAAVTRGADVIVSAAGVAGLLTAEHVRPGAVVIDAGTNAIGAGDAFRLVGDAEFDEVADVAGAITPVPGGVGPVTTAVLLRTVVELAERL